MRRGQSVRDSRDIVSGTTGRDITPPIGGCPGQVSRETPAHLLLTIEEVAEVLRTTRKAIYAMIEREQLPGVRRLGRRILVSRQELLHFLDHTCASSPKEQRR
jgi:excisionase family DNA binding protein